MAARHDAVRSFAPRAGVAPPPAIVEARLPRVVVRGRSFLALILTPESPLEAWFAALDAQVGEAGGFFADRPVVANLAPIAGRGGRDGALAALDGLAARDFRLIGAEGVEAALLSGSPWSGLPTVLHAREGRGEDPPLTMRPAASAQASAPEPVPRIPPPSAPALLIERPVRSGQSILFEEGDVTIVGSVASGAEVIAGGSVHVYGPLRGRAIAGVRTGAEARIFCRRLEAELLAVDGCYRTADHWGAGLHGHAVRARCDGAALRLEALS